MNARALVTVFLLATGVATTGHALLNQQPDLFVAGFSVEVDGFPGGGGGGGSFGPLLVSDRFTVSVGDIGETTVLAVEIDDLEVRTQQQPSPTGQVQQPVALRPGNVTLEIPVGPQVEPFDAWWTQVRNGADVKKDVEIVILEPDGDPARQITLLDCLPVRRGAGEVRTTGTSLLTRSFTLAIGRVELEGTTTGLPDGQWDLVSGGAEERDLPAQGAPGSHFAGSGAVTVSPLTLSGPMTRRSWIGTWFDLLNQEGPQAKRTVTIRTQRPDGGDGPARTYQGAFPVRYVFPKLDAATEEALRETLVFQADQVDLETSGSSPASAPPPSGGSEPDEPEPTASEDSGSDESAVAPPSRPSRPTFRREQPSKPAPRKLRPLLKKKGQETDS